MTYFTLARKYINGEQVPKLLCPINAVILPYKDTFLQRIKYFFQKDKKKRIYLKPRKQDNKISSIRKIIAGDNYSGV